MGRMHTLLSRVSKSCLSPSNSVQQPHEGTGPFDDSEVMDLVESLEDGAESLVGEVNDSTHPGVVWQYNVSSNPELTRARQKGCGHYRTISHDTNISEDFDRLLDMPEVDGVEMVNLSQAAAAAAAAAGVSVCDEDGALSSRLTGHLSMPHTPPTSAVGSPAALSPELEDIRSDMSAPGPSDMSLADSASSWQLHAASGKSTTPAASHRKTSRLAGAAGADALEEEDGDANDDDTSSSGSDDESSDEESAGQDPKCDQGSRSRTKTSPVPNLGWGVTFLAQQGQLSPRTCEALELEAELERERVRTTVEMAEAVQTTQECATANQAIRTATRTMRLEQESKGWRKQLIASGAYERSQQAIDDALQAASTSAARRIMDTSDAVLVEEARMIVEMKRQGVLAPPAHQASSSHAAQPRNYLGRRRHKGAQGSARTPQLPGVQEEDLLANLIPDEEGVMGPLSSTTDSDSTRSSAAPSPANPSANAQLNPVLHAQKILQQKCELKGLDEEMEGLQAYAARKVLVALAARRSAAAQLVAAQQAGLSTHRSSSMSATPRGMMTPRSLANDPSLTPRTAAMARELCTPRTLQALQQCLTPRTTSQLLVSDPTGSDSSLSSNNAATT
eukprot:CAMPEP_0114234700 /NCGR_PEP_ID=MMETSP0058-20121206/5847_1 /TAXON_ID=36894 /ORGANISM="Pyramimonas parkeae, CCMP726" /LENGTH=618 /DNA_ID=CAMNT_0001346393 /DNA_START=135 /DNA_END=1991 /DNA_ORIENTATION=+